MCVYMFAFGSFMWTQSNLFFFFLSVNLLIAIAMPARKFAAQLFHAIKNIENDLRAPIRFLQILNIHNNNNRLFLRLFLIYSRSFFLSNHEKNRKSPQMFSLNNNQKWLSLSQEYRNFVFVKWDPKRKSSKLTRAHTRDKLSIWQHIEIR